MSKLDEKSYAHFDLRGGGFKFNLDFWENTILRYELAMMARKCTNILKVVLTS